jgi:thiamine biosynthesis lipoprotein
MSAPEHDVSFPCMGSTVRLLVGEGPRAGEEAARAARDYLDRFDRRLSRFRPDSELCALNRHPRAEFRASPLLRAAVKAGLWAARTTGGLVDPTLVGALERAGYDRSLAERRSASLELALAAAPPRRPARPDPRGAWRRVSVDERHGLVRRPPGVRFDTGGTGKGLAADAVAGMLAGHTRFAVDCGGDLRVGGTGAAEPFEIEVEHPLTRERVHAIRLSAGAVATSGIDTRLWEDDAGRWAHHLLDPSTGEPAWTGLIACTAIACTAVEAEVLAKAALLSGAEGARRVLARQGGLIVHEDGDVELAGPLRARRRPRVTVPLAAFAGRRTEAV